MSNQNGPTHGQRMPPAVWAALPDTVKLAMFEEAAYALSTGQIRVEIRHGEYFTRYGLGSTTYLQREIARLRAIVGRRHGFTVGPQPVIGGGCDPFSNPRRWR